MDAHEEEGEGEGEEDELLEEITLKDKRSQWDCESIVSTYSNLYNHPAVIGAPENRIKLNKRGFPDIKPKEEEEEEEEEDEEEKVNSGIPRQRNETLEQKKQRKKAVKEERKLKREQKKDLKVAYKEETIKQQTEVAGKIVNRTILHY
eukprot:TRINITY_DN1941_c0_g1_i1.p1 TRINITY_DN1941_c0_g1~~TRINITY_DN1941_c0_g1_i1.p1  ORF type:complete len:148 (+),score=50.52 TRINITY_DN1941_c0_g1_i1:3-446(+)